MMHVAPDAPRRPALRYYGGKWNLAPWIISHFPEHQNYVEPCGGAASVLLQKPRSPLETYNDLDGNVVNFFRVLRDSPNELIRKIRLTPWARAEYELSLEPCEDDVEQARRFYVALHLGIPGSMRTTAGQLRFAVDYTRCPYTPILYRETIEFVVARFIGVQIDQRDVCECVSKYDHPSALFYVDPPYVGSERSNPNVYFEEWDDADHTRAAALLRTCQGYVVVSGYACGLYTKLYEAHGWQRFDKEAQTNSGGKRLESLWLSPRTVEALQQPQQAPLFAQVQVMA